MPTPLYIECPTCGAPPVGPTFGYCLIKGKGRPMPSRTHMARVRAWAAMPWPEKHAAQLRYYERVGTPMACCNPEANDHA